MDLLQAAEEGKKPQGAVPVCPGGKFLPEPGAGDAWALPRARGQDLPPRPTGWSCLPGDAQAYSPSMESSQGLARKAGHGTLLPFILSRGVGTAALPGGGPATWG